MSGDETDLADERRLLGVPSRSGTASELPMSLAPLVSDEKRRYSGFNKGWISGFTDALGRSFEHEITHGNTFLFVPVFLGLGALLYFTSSQEPGFTPLLLSLALLLALSAATRARPSLRAAFLAATMTVTGMLAGKIETWRAGTAMIGSEISTRLTARVARVEHQASGRVRLTLDVIATERPQLRYAPDRLRATARAVPDGLRPGNVVHGVVRLMPASGPTRPLSYDFSFRSYFDGIGAVGFFLSGPELSAAEWPPPGFLMRVEAQIEDWRQRMATRIETSIGGPEGAIAAALITGVRAGIPEDINEALRITGLYHVISISGLHMALVGGTVMVAMRTVFALAPTFSMRRPVKKYSAAAALAATAFYLLISGGDVAATRSFLMLAVMLIAVMCDRAALTMRNLAISAIIILLVTPHEVVGPSFQMSFAATAALVAAYAAWTSYRERRMSGPPPRRTALAVTVRTGAKYAGGMSLTSIVAGLATALFTAWHFQQVSPLGLVANLTAMPFVSVIVMPMAVLASLLMPIGLDGPPLWLMGQGIAAMNAIAIWLAERSAFDATGAIPLPAVLTLTTALAILTMAGSNLRWAAMPLTVVGVALLLFQNAKPHVLVSEDGRLVAIAMSNGGVAVNRPRPRAFTMQNWQRAMDTKEIVRPERFSGTDDVWQQAEQVSAESSFLCREDLCVARHTLGAVVVHAPDEDSAVATCMHATLIVIDDATASNPCQPDTLVITKRDLARRGSAEIVFRPGATGPKAEVRFAIAEPYRPWHEHRRFSREARGLAPWQRQQAPSEPQSPEQ